MFSGFVLHKPIAYYLLFQMPHESAVGSNTRELTTPDISAILRNTSIKVGHTELPLHYCKEKYNHGLEVRTNHVSLL